MGDTESIWVEQAQGGDSRAMEQLYRAHAPAVHDYALRFARNRDVAEEVTQETFIRAFRSIGRFRGQSKFRTWLFSIAINRLRTEMQKRSKRSSDLDISDVEIGEEGPTPSGMSRRALQRALAALPEGYREVVLMHDVQGMGHGEIAQLRGTSVGTSKSQLHKARAKLREILKEQEMEAAC
ncbi:MAG: sigma-70 family RNA polymerase sigma factor [Myxococcota bacterium]